MPKSLADGNIKFTVLTTKPAGAVPTAAELNAGKDWSCNVLFSDFRWSATASDTIAERALCDKGNPNVPGADNFEAALTIFRYYDLSDKQFHATEDLPFQTVKLKGTEFWGYTRTSPKEHSEVWAADDEIGTGLHVVTDNTQEPSDLGGWIKKVVPVLVQSGFVNAVIVAGGGGGG